MKLIQVTRYLTLLSAAAFVIGCGKPSQVNSARNADELAVLAQSSFYEGEVVATNQSSDGGFIPTPGGSGGSGNDQGTIPGTPSEPTTPTVPPVDPVTPPATEPPIAQNPPTTPTEPTQPAPTNPVPPSQGPTIPVIPTDPVSPPVAGGPGSNDGGTIPTPPGQGPSNPDGGTVPPTNPPTNPPSDPNGPIVENPPAQPPTDPTVPPTNPPTDPTVPTPPEGPIVENPPTTPPPGDGGTVPPGTNPPNPPGDGGTLPCPNCPATNVTLYRVCSQKRSLIPFPEFVFFEEARDPILSIEARVTMPATVRSTTLASVGGSMPHPMHSTLLNIAINPQVSSSKANVSVAAKDLADVDLMAGKYKTRLQYALNTIQAWYPQTWKQIYVSAKVCDDRNKDGFCQDETVANNLLAKEVSFKLAHIPKELKLLVWNGRSKTLARDPRLCEEQYSPIVLDLAGNGFQFSSAPAGVWFDLNNTGEPVLTGWTNGLDDAFLVRDINGNGRIDSGAELFGSATLLANGARAENGFKAMAELDSNANGVLDAGDAAWSSLRLWIDRSHDGESSESELYTLNAAKVLSINVTYLDSTEVDTHGNETRQRSVFRREVRGQSVPRQVIDVWFNTLGAE